VHIPVNEGKMLRLALTLIAIMIVPVFAYTSEPVTIYYTTSGAEQHFTIFQRQQVVPKYLSISDATGQMGYLNPGPVPEYPSTFGVKLCYSKPFDIYSAIDSERLEVWQDVAGVATVEQILAVCPQFAQ